MLNSAHFMPCWSWKQCWRLTERFYFSIIWNRRPFPGFWDLGWEYLVRSSGVAETACDICIFVFEYSCILVICECVWIVFVLVFCLLCQSALLEKWCSLKGLALLILYNYLSPSFNGFFTILAPVRTFSKTIDQNYQILTWYHIIGIY